MQETKKQRERGTNLDPPTFFSAFLLDCIYSTHPLMFKSYALCTDGKVGDTIHTHYDIVIYAMISNSVMLVTT